MISKAEEIQAFLPPFTCVNLSRFVELGWIDTQGWASNVLLLEASSIVLPLA